MDEPTNHLDIWSCEALERSIREFEGTVLVVSHDRYFLNQVADRLIVVADGKARVIEGDYETYQRLAQQEAEAAPARGPAKAETQAAKAADGIREAEAEVPLPQVGRPGARDRRGRGPGRRARGSAGACPRPGAIPSRHARTQQRHDDLREALAQLYAHWEEAVEFNSEGTSRLAITVCVLQ